MDKVCKDIVTGEKRQNDKKNKAWDIILVEWC